MFRLPRAWETIWENFLSPCLTAPGGVIILKGAATEYFVLLGLSAPLGLVSLASERAETPRAPKEGIIQRFLRYFFQVTL